MIPVDANGITYAILEKEAPRVEHYFYCYQMSEGGLWFNTILARTKEEAAASLTYLTKPLFQKKLCCVML